MGYTLESVLLHQFFRAHCVFDFFLLLFILNIILIKYRIGIAIESKDTSHPFFSFNFDKILLPHLYSHLFYFAYFFFFLALSSEYLLAFAATSIEPLPGLCSGAFRLLKALLNSWVTWQCTQS